MNIRQTISDLIVDKIIEENASTGGQSPTAQDLHLLAKAAIFNGQRDTQGRITTQWRAYMTFLLTGRGGGPANPDDLRRLLPEEDDGTAAEARQKDRAYLIANGMCGTGTGDAILINGNPTAALDQ